MVERGLRDESLCTYFILYLIQYDSALHLVCTIFIIMCQSFVILYAIGTRIVVYSTGLICTSQLVHNPCSHQKRPPVRKTTIGRDPTRCSPEQHHSDYPNSVLTPISNWRVIVIWLSAYSSRISIHSPRTHVDLQIFAARGSTSMPMLGSQKPCFGRT